MTRLKMSWNTEGGRLVCRWIESNEREKREPLSVDDRYGSTALQVNRRGRSRGRAVK